jgi:hypothetical protein
MVHPIHHGSRIAKANRESGCYACGVYTTITYGMELGFLASDNLELVTISRAIRQTVRQTQSVPHNMSAASMRMGLRPQ